MVVRNFDPVPHRAFRRHESGLPDKLKLDGRVGIREDQNAEATRWRRLEVPFAIAYRDINKAGLLRPEESGDCRLPDEIELFSGPVPMPKPPPGERQIRGHFEKHSGAFGNRDLSGRILDRLGVTLQVLRVPYFERYRLEAWPVVRDHVDGRRAVTSRLPPEIEGLTYRRKETHRPRGRWRRLDADKVVGNGTLFLDL